MLKGRVLHDLEVAEGSKEDIYLTSGVPVTWNVGEKQSLRAMRKVSSENFHISEGRL